VSSGTFSSGPTEDESDIKIHTRWLERVRRVGKAQRAHRKSYGGHASLCPPYKDTQIGLKGPLNNANLGSKPPSACNPAPAGRAPGTAPSAKRRPWSRCPWRRCP